MAHMLESTLYLVEHTDDPHKGHAALEHVKRALHTSTASCRAATTTRFKQTDRRAGHEEC